MSVARTFERVHFAIGTVMLLLFLCAAPTRASGSVEPPAATDPIQASFDKGNRLAKQRRWMEARVAFLEAWALQRSWQGAANLGHCEMELGRYAEAAFYYAYYLREGPADRKQQAKGLLDKARAKVGTLNVQTDRASADVLIDGVLIGKSPLSEPVFVKPGTHSLQMRVGTDVLAEQPVDAAEGGSYDITLAAKADRSAAPVNLTQPAKQSPVVGQPEKAPPGASLPEGSKLPGRKIVIGTGIGATAALLGTGVAFAIVSNQHASDARVLREQTRKDVGSEACPTPGQGSPACQELLALGKDQRLSGNVAIFTFIAGGLIGGGTLAYSFVKPKVSSSSTVQAVPVIGAGSTGVIVRGSW